MIYYHEGNNPPYLCLVNGQYWGMIRGFIEMREGWTDVIPFGWIDDVVFQGMKKVFGESGELVLKDSRTNETVKTLAYKQWSVSGSTPNHYTTINLIT